MRINKIDDKMDSLTENVMEFRKVAGNIVKVGMRIQYTMPLWE